MNKITPYLFWVRVAMAVLLLAFIVFLQIGGKNSQTDIDTMAKAVTESVDMARMQESTNRLFKKFYGLNASDFEGVALYTPVSNMEAEEILIVKLQSNAQADMVKAAVMGRLESQKSSFEGYGIEQYDLLEKHILDIKGNYVLYVVHTDASEADQAFRDSL